MAEHKAFFDGSDRAEEDDCDSMIQALLDREERRLLASASTVPDGVDEWRALVAAVGFVRRSSVLARGAPLHRIDQRQAWQRFPRGLYDPRTLALAALEAVVSRQEMEAEATTEEVVEFLASLAAGAAPERETSEHLAVSRFVLRELLNDAQHGEEFEVSYSDYRAGHSRVTLSLRMLEEGIGRRGQAVLRATTPAINLLLSGLEHDLEDEQAAKDTMLRRQVASGRWGRAEESAAESLKLSLMYCERVRAVLEETERDVRAVDWSRDVPVLLTASREHLGERLRVERDLMEYMRGVRNAVEDADVLRTCERVLRLLSRAHLRHTQLLEKIIDARPAFLRSQADQRFRPPPRLALVGVQEDVLEPLLLPRNRGCRSDREPVRRCGRRSRRLTSAAASGLVGVATGPGPGSTGGSARRGHRADRRRPGRALCLQPGGPRCSAHRAHGGSAHPGAAVPAARTGAGSHGKGRGLAGCHPCYAPMPPIPRRTRRTMPRTSWRTCSVNSWWCSMTAPSSTSVHSRAVTCCSSPPSR